MLQVVLQVPRPFVEQQGQILEEDTVATTGRALRNLFSDLVAARVVIEVGTHSPSTSICACTEVAPGEEGEPPSPSPARLRHTDSFAERPRGGPTPRTSSLGSSGYRLGSL